MFQRKRKQLSKPTLPPQVVEEAFAKELYGALLARHGSSEAIPSEEFAAARKLVDVEEGFTQAFLATPRPSSASRALSPTATHSSRRTRSKARSVVRAYIRDRPTSSQNAGFAQQDSYNLRRVLTEIQMRMPAMKRLQHNIDLDTEAGQARSFTTVFGLLDEDGSGNVSLEEFIAFGRRVGGECSRVFNTKLFMRIDVQNKGEVSKDDFIAVLFPKFAQYKQRKELAEQQLLAKKREVAKWQDEWHTEHLETVETIFRSCDQDKDGFVSLEDICRVYSVVPSQKWIGGKQTVEEDFLSIAPNKSSTVQIKEFAILMRPTFSNAPQMEIAEITEFYYEGAAERW